MHAEPPPDVWIDPRLVVRESSIEGCGLFFTTAMPSATVVMRLGGRLVATQELARLIAAAENEPAAAFVDTVTMHEGQHLVLPPSTPLHFMNHSCDPTLWHVRPYQLATRRPVAPGEEATVDSGTHSGAPGFAMACRCRAAACRGVITSDDWRRPELQRRYGEHWVPALATRIGVEDVARAGEVARAAAERTHALLRRLRQLGEAELRAPSALPDWDRLTIVCHLRYGARALLRMTGDVLAGRETSYYPEGRVRQRAETLVPAPGERPADVLDDWDSASTELDRTWSTLDDTAWRTEVVEPADNQDLGAIPPRAPRAGPPHRARRECRPAEPSTVADATIGGSRRDLLALLLGRPHREPLRLAGDEAFARAFTRAFPGP